MDEPRNPGDLPLFNGSPSIAEVLRAGAPTPTVPKPPAPPSSSDDRTPPPSAGGRRRRVDVRVGDDDEVDWSLVATLRGQVSEQLSIRLGEKRSATALEDQHELGRAIIREVLKEHASTAIDLGRTAFDRDHERVLEQALFDAVFGLGRLQQLVDNDEVENIMIMGSDNVVLQLASGEQIPGPPVASSDAELIDNLMFLASRSEVNARPFSESQPWLHMKLDDGSRLAAAAWITPRPQVVIRRHRIKEVTLQGLVELGTISPAAASFLDAAVRARRSIVVAGPQGAGKTTLVRALCHSIDPEESIGTFETEYELMLHEMPERHPLVRAFEARPGSGEVGIDGRQAGEITIDDHLYNSFRMNLSRQIVGEVRGREVLAMIKAMSSGTGSISTTHASSATATIGKLVTCALEAGPHVTVPYATRAIADGIDFVVQLHLERPRGGKPERWVSEIVAVEAGEAERGYALTHVFSPKRGGGPAVPGTLPEHLRYLTEYGFNLDAFQAEADHS